MRHVGWWTAMGCLVASAVLMGGGCRNKAASVPPPAPGQRNTGAVPAATAPAADPRLVGFWKASGGDYALVNEYRADGMLVQHVGSRSTTPSPYRVEGEYIIISLKQPSGEVTEDKERFAVNGDVLMFFDEDGSTRVFRRKK